MGAGVVKPRPDGQPGFQIHIHNSNINFGPTATQSRTFSTTCTTSTSTTSTNSQGPSTGTSTAGSSTGTTTTTTTTPGTADPGAGPDTMSCEDCSVVFTVFKRKKACKDCGRLFCSACTTQLSSGTGRSSPFTPKEVQCKKCQIIRAGNFSRTLLLKWKIKDLKAMLDKQKVNTTKCKEKNDLIDLLFRYFGTPANLERLGTEHERLVEQMKVRMSEEHTSSAPVSPNHTRPTRPSKDAARRSTEHIRTTTASVSSSSTSSQQPEGGGQQERQSREMAETEARLQQQLDDEEDETQEAQSANPHLRLEDIQSEEEIELLTIKSLKRLLLNNFVDYKGCCERWEFLQRVTRLWRDNQTNLKKADEQRKTHEDPTSTSGAPQPEDDLCKICMDATIDCVLLECGHMVTCTQCGKRLSECPICRQYVIRAVHTFKS